MFSAVQLMFRGLCGLSLISNTAAIDSRRFIQHATIGRQRNTKTSTFIVHTQIKLVFFLRALLIKLSATFWLLAGSIQSEIKTIYPLDDKLFNG